MQLHPRRTQDIWVSGIEVAQKQKIFSQCLYIWVYKRGFCFLGPLEWDINKLHHSVFDLALNVFIFFLILPSHFSLAWLLAWPFWTAFLKKCQVIPNKLGKTIMNYNSTWSTSPKNARAGWQLLLLCFWHSTCWETQLTNLTWFCSF